VWAWNAGCCLEKNRHLISSSDENNFDLDSLCNIRHLQAQMCHKYKYQSLHVSVFLSIVSSIGVVFKKRLKLRVHFRSDLTVRNTTINTAINSHSHVTTVLNLTVWLLLSISLPRSMKFSWVVKFARAENKLLGRTVGLEQGDGARSLYIPLNNGGGGGCLLYRVQRVPWWTAHVARTRNARS